MSELGKTLASTITDVREVERQVGNVPGSIFRYDVFRETVGMEGGFVKITGQTMGSSFVLAHSDLGRLGVVAAPQPYLGDSRSGAQLRRLVQDTNFYRERFITTDFKDTATTADWNTGSQALYFSFGGSVVINDQSSINNGILLNGTQDLVPGQFSTSGLRFSGSPFHIKVISSNSADWQLSGLFTLEGWIRTSANDFY